MRAAELFAKGESQADIARELNVAHQTVSDWHEKWRVGGHTVNADRKGEHLRLTTR